MGYSRRDVEKTISVRKKFVSYNEASELYSLGRNKITDLAREAGAVYKIEKSCLVNTDILEQYLETFRLAPEEK